MKIAVNQAYFFPYIGFFQLIESVDKFIIYENVSFRRRSWITRNQLLNKATGKPFYFGIPVRKKSSFSLIKDIKITENYQEWQRHLLGVLLHNYSKAPHFLETIDLLKTILESNKSDNIHGFNSHIIKDLCVYLEINTCIQYRNAKYDNLEKELDFLYALGEEGVQIKTDRKVQRILDICHKEGAKTYVNLPGGQDLYNSDIFNENNFDLQFLNLPKPRYMQFKNEFVPHLSIIDVLMHNGKEGTKALIERYSLLSPKMKI